MDKTPIILLGAQRSGTTGLAYALNIAFSDIGGMFTVNGKVLYLLHRWLKNDDLLSKHLRVDEILHALKRKIPDGIGSHEWFERVEYVLRDAATLVVDSEYPYNEIKLGMDILKEIYSPYTVWGDKYNEYLLHLDYIDSVIPNARYILLIRHPNEIANSILNWTGDRPWRSSTRDSAFKKWDKWNSNWVAFESKIPDDRKIVIEYSELCFGTDKERLSNFLNLDLSVYLKGMIPRSVSSNNAVLPCETLALWENLNNLRFSDL